MKYGSRIHCDLFILCLLQRPLVVPGPGLAHTDYNPVRALAVKRAQRLTPHGGVLLLTCCHLGVYLPGGLHLEVSHRACTHPLLSNIAAVFTFYHGAYIWAWRVFLKTATEPCVCTEMSSVVQAEKGKAVGFPLTLDRPDEVCSWICVHICLWFSLRKPDYFISRWIYFSKHNISSQFSFSDQYSQQNVLQVSKANAEEWACSESGDNYSVFVVVVGKPFF